MSPQTTWLCGPDRPPARPAHLRAMTQIDPLTFAAFNHLRRFSCQSRHRPYRGRRRQRWRWWGSQRGWWRWQRTTKEQGGQVEREKRSSCSGEGCCSCGSFSSTTSSWRKKTTAWTTTTVGEERNSFSRVGGVRRTEKCDWMRTSWNEWLLIQLLCPCSISFLKICIFWKSKLKTYTCNSNGSSKKKFLLKINKHLYLLNLIWDTLT